MNEAVDAIVRAIHTARRILVICHVDADGDSIGSLLGLGEALRRLAKEVTLASPNRPSPKYRFLPRWDSIVTGQEGEFDLFISLDCSDDARLGDYQAFVKARPEVPLINIDHHVTNVRFGKLNWVETEATATAEMIVELIDALDLEIDRELALPLLTGIVTDTRGFRTPNTTSRVLRIASRLIDAGVLLAEIMERTVNVRSFSTICLWSKMLEQTRLEGRIIWSILTPEMQRACNGTFDGEGGFVNFLASTQEADVSALFTDRGNGCIEVGLRAKPGVNVAEVALRLGGGGHPQAAGCTLKGKLQTVREMVLEALREAIVDQESTYS